MLQTLDRLEVAGKSILVRASVIVPIADGQSADDDRVRASIMTIDEIAEQGVLSVVTSPLGRERSVVLMLESLAEGLPRGSGKMPVKFENSTENPRACICIWSGDAPLQLKGYSSKHITIAVNDKRRGKLKWND